MSSKASYGGAVLALLFWWSSLTPTFIPRPWAVQVAISAICLAIAYGLGSLIQRFIHRPVAWRPQWIVLVAAWLVSAVVGGAAWVGWQNEQRAFMQMESVGWLDALLMVTLSIVVGALLIGIARLIAGAIAGINRLVRRQLSAVLAALATTVLIAGVGGVLVGLAIAVVDAHYSGVNDETEEGIVEPNSPSVSGTSASLVSWDGLGRHGRTFVATATSAQELEKFHGANAHVVQPVRVYVGVRSAATLADRADLAVRELERTGGFERKVLVVWLPTGSGWMVREAAVAIEQLYAGDTAIVAIQYSYLSSLIAGIVDPEEANEAGRQLFNAVYARWSQTPPEGRPKLVVFGKSLGTQAVEAPFVATDARGSVANLVTRTDGALIVGAPYDNPILRQLTREREPGSTVWQPVFDAGRSARFLNHDPRQPVLDSAWLAPRIVYLQHPSDPATFWALGALWWPPEWMNQPRGFDVPAAARWFPIVSGVQAIADLVEQLSTPPGFGHVYWTDYVKGWAQAVPPDGWTDADTARLEAFLHGGGAAQEHAEIGRMARLPR